jgi:D-hydroxyproline dehydrogenase subunit gamma
VDDVLQPCRFALRFVFCRYIYRIPFVYEASPKMKKIKSIDASPPIEAPPQPAPTAAVRGTGAVRKPGVSGEKLSFSFNGAAVEGMAGDSVAAALLVAGITTLRTSPQGGTPRGPFCWMGVCQECTVVIDGVRRPACRTALVAGMQVMPGTIA